MNMGEEKICPYCKKEKYSSGEFDEKKNSFNIKRQCCEDCIEIDKRHADYISKGYYSEYYEEFSKSKIKKLKEDDLPGEVWDNIEYTGEYVDRGYEAQVDNNGDFIEDDGKYQYKK